MLSQDSATFEVSKKGRGEREEERQRKGITEE